MHTPPEETALESAPCRHCGDVHPLAFSHCPNTGRSLSSGRALIGKVIAGRYRVLALIGEGGMGAVYAAEHLLMGRKVALKRLHPELAADEKSVARFQREARAAAATGHEHIVEILDLGFGEDGAPFLVMEYLRGKSLAVVLDEEKRLEPRRACRIVGQVLAALGSVHRRGIVHRDLKPDNIILTRRRGDPEFVKVVDFGISKMRQEDTERGMALTRTGVMLGTPFYMSPEQARGMKDLDHRVDLFGAGVMLYESLTGQLPFSGENYHQLLQAILSGKRPPVLTLRPDLSPGLGEVMEKALAQSPANRYQSARDMLLALVPHGAVDPGVIESEPPPRGAPISFGSTFGARPTLESNWGAATTRGATPAKPDARSWNDASSDPGSPEAGSSDAATRDAGRWSPPPTDAAAFVSSSTPSSTASIGDSAARSPRSSRGTPAPQGLAPAPRDIHPPARRYAAQSADWRGGSGLAFSSGSHARSAYRDITRIATPRGSHTPVPEAVDVGTPASDTHEDPTRVKASLVLAAIDHIRQLGPRSWEGVLGRIDAEPSARLSAVILPMAWVSLGDYVELLRAAEREIGHGETSVAVQIGQATAERELASTHRLFMQTATPTMAVERIPQLFRTYHAGGRAEVHPATAGGYRIESLGLTPDALPHAMAMSGFYQRLIELTGGRDVRASVVACKERGDSETAIVLRWR